LQRLWKKYHVQVNRKLLKELNINTPDAALAAENIITMDGQDITAGEFMQQVRAQQKFRREYGFRDSAFNYKAQVLGGIISQTLTTRAGLDHHYEKKPPFDKVFRFYPGTGWSWPWKNRCSCRGQGERRGNQDLL